MAAASLRSKLSGTRRVLAKELSAFGVVGMTAFVVDLAAFQLLYAEVGLGAVTAKLIASVLSTTVAFVGHRFWSFSHRAHTQLHRDYGRFAVVNVGALMLSLGVVAFVRYPLGQTDALVLQAANIASITLGTVFRFLAYRSWVFPARAAAPGTETSSAREPGTLPAEHDLQPRGDAGAQLLDVTDDADRAAAAAQLVEDVHHRVE
jgi:putative flippase GtrA